MINEISKNLKPLNKRRNTVIAISAVNIIAGLLPPYLIGKLIDDLYPDFAGATAYIYIIISIIGLLFLTFALSWLQGFLSADLTNRGAGIVRVSLFKHVLHQDYRFFQTHPVGDINNKVLNDTASYVKTKLMMIPMLVLNILHIFVLFFFLFRLNIKMTILVIMFTLIFIIVSRGINKKLRYYKTKEREEFSDLMTETDATLIGVDTIQLYAGEDFAVEYFEKLVDIYEEDLTHLQFWQTLSKAATNSISSLVPVATVVAGVLYLALGGNISIGNIIAFYYFLPRLKEPFKAISDFNLDVQNAKVLESRLADLLVRDVDEKEKMLVNKIDEFEFIDVNFSHEDDHVVLKDVNVKLYRGDALAVVGPSGAGKSTLLRLLKRQLTPTSGVIAVNGVDYSQIEPSSYISRIAVLPQNVFIFDDSIFDNISFGKDYTREHVENVARLSGLDYYSLDENAQVLSGGERQRIGLARALACEFDVLILDEPTSELDHETECVIIENLKRVQKETNCIMIVVTHSQNMLDKLCTKELTLPKI